MAKRLSIEQIEQMKTMVKNGEKPEDIAKHFGVAISSVHNHKAKFKAEGLEFPNVRGQRPVGEVSTKNTVKTPKAVQKVKQVKSVDSVQSNRKSFDIVMNGVQISISGDARNVNINPNRLEIDF